MIDNNKKNEATGKDGKIGEATKEETPDSSSSTTVVDPDAEVKKGDPVVGKDEDGNTTITTPTEFDREKLLEFNKIHPTFDENRLVVKPNPVTVPTGSVTPWEERKRQFVFAGRLEELKGLRTVIEAWRILGKDAPLLLVAGDGPLADWAKAQNLPKVQFVGQLPRDALHRLMAESRAVVAASLCYESFALVPAEAHALGTPVLASGIGNVGASVRPGFDGLCFAPGDPAALAGAVRAMSAMQFDCTAIANATRRRFSAEENYKTLLKLYGRRAVEEVS